MIKRRSDKGIPIEDIRLRGVQRQAVNADAEGDGDGKLSPEEGDKQLQQQARAAKRNGDTSAGFSAASNASSFVLKSPGSLDAEIDKLNKMASFADAVRDNRAKLTDPAFDKNPLRTYLKTGTKLLRKDEQQVRGKLQEAIEKLDHQKVIPSLVSSTTRDKAQAKTLQREWVASQGLSPQVSAFSEQLLKAGLSPAQSAAQWTLMGNLPSFLKGELSASEYAVDVGKNASIAAAGASGGALVAGLLRSAHPKLRGIHWPAGFVAGLLLSRKLHQVMGNKRGLPAPTQQDDTKPPSPQVVAATQALRAEVDRTVEALEARLEAEPDVARTLLATTQLLEHRGSLRAQLEGAKQLLKADLDERAGFTSLRRVGAAALGAVRDRAEDGPSFRERAADPELFGESPQRETVRALERRLAAVDSALASLDGESDGAEVQRGVDFVVDEVAELLESDQQALDPEKWIGGRLERFAQVLANKDLAGAAELQAAAVRAYLSVADHQGQSVQFLPDQTPSVTAVVNALIQQGAVKGVDGPVFTSDRLSELLPKLKEACAPLAKQAQPPLPTVDAKALEGEVSRLESLEKGEPHRRILDRTSLRHCDQRLKSATPAWWRPTQLAVRTAKALPRIFDAPETWAMMAVGAVTGNRASQAFLGSRAGAPLSNRPLARLVVACALDGATFHSGMNLFNHARGKPDKADWSAQAYARSTLMRVVSAKLGNSHAERLHKLGEGVDLASRAAEEARFFAEELSANTLAGVGESYLRRGDLEGAGQVFEDNLQFMVAMRTLGGAKAATRKLQVRERLARLLRAQNRDAPDAESLAQELEAQEVLEKALLGEEEAPALEPNEVQLKLAELDEKNQFLRQARDMVVDALFTRGQAYQVKEALGDFDVLSKKIGYRDDWSPDTPSEIVRVLKECLERQESVLKQSGGSKGLRWGWHTDQMQGAWRRNDKQAFLQKLHGGLSELVGPAEAVERIMADPKSTQTQRDEAWAQLGTKVSEVGRQSQAAVYQRFSGFLKAQAKAQLERSGTELEDLGVKLPEDAQLQKMFPDVVGALEGLAGVEATLMAKVRADIPKENWDAVRKTVRTYVRNALAASLAPYVGGDQKLLQVLNDAEAEVKAMPFRQVGAGLANLGGFGVRKAAGATVGRLVGQEKVDHALDRVSQEGRRAKAAVKKRVPLLARGEQRQERIVSTVKEGIGGVLGGTDTKQNDALEALNAQLKADLGALVGTTPSSKAALEEMWKDAAATAKMMRRAATALVIATKPDLIPEEQREPALRLAVESMPRFMKLLQNFGGTEVKVRPADEARALIDSAYSAYQDAPEGPRLSMATNRLRAALRSAPMDVLDEFGERLPAAAPKAKQADTQAAPAKESDAARTPTRKQRVARKQEVGAASSGKTSGKTTGKPATGADAGADKQDVVGILLEDARKAHRRNDSLIKKLAREVQDKVTPMPEGRPEEKVRQGLAEKGDGVLDRIKEFGKDRLGSASMAEVQSAVVSDGDKELELAFKVWRDEVGPSFEQEDRVVKVLLPLFSGLAPEPIKQSALFKAVTNQVPSAMASFDVELDAPRELNSSVRAHLQRRRNARVYAPKAYPELSGEDFIATQRMEGDPLSVYLRRAERSRTAPDPERGPVGSLEEALSRVRQHSHKDYGLDAAGTQLLEETPKGWRVKAFYDDSRAQPYATFDITREGRVKPRGVVPDFSAEGLVRLAALVPGSRIAQLLLDHRMQGDPQEKNWAVRADGKSIVEYDFGQEVELANRELLAPMRLFRGLSNKKPATISRALLSMAGLKADAQQGKVRRELEAAVARGLADKPHASLSDTAKAALLAVNEVGLDLRGDYYHLIKSCAAVGEQVAAIAQTVQRAPPPGQEGQSNEEGAASPAPMSSPLLTLGLGEVVSEVATGAALKVAWPARKVAEWFNAKTEQRTDPRREP